MVLVQTLFYIHNIKKTSNYKTEFEKNASLQNIKYQNIQDITKSLIVIFIPIILPL